MGWTFPCLAGLFIWLAIFAIGAWRTREVFEAGSGAESVDDVTVLIPARNEAETLPLCLRSLADQGEGLKIIVIDDQSSDMTFKFARNALAGRVRVIAGPGHMFGALKTEYLARSTIGRLRWTHGALYRDASLGFALSDLPHWNAPDAVRFDQALLPLAKPTKQDMTAYQITR